MNFAFIIQGEGRGHISQAIAMKQLIEKHGHQLTDVFVGISRERRLPEYFCKHFTENVMQFASPNFCYNTERMKIRLVKSLIANLFRSQKYFRSIHLIRKKLSTTKPDCIINFCDLVGGLALSSMQGEAKKIAVAHHYYYHHPTFQFPKNRFAERWLFKMHNKISMAGSDKILALSYKPLPPHKKIKIVPPLIRNEVRLLEQKQENYFLVYILNSGYQRQLEKEEKERIILFSEKPPIKAKKSNIDHKTLNDTTFLSYLSGCKAYLSSAGFESICEANYLGKPVYMVPTQNHFEQYCNALDAAANGLGQFANRFDNINFNQEPDAKSQSVFKAWADQADVLILQEVFS